MMIITPMKMKIWMKMMFLLMMMKLDQLWRRSQEWTQIVKFMPVILATVISESLRLRVHVPC